MFKKLGSLLLALIMLSTMAIIPASAVVTQVLLDDFETGNVGSVSQTAGNGYYTSSSASGLFIAPGKPVNSNGISISQTAGFDGTAGLVMEVGAGSGLAHVTSKAIPMTYGAAGNDLIASYKLKFLSLPTASDSAALADTWLLLSHDYKKTDYYSYGYASVCASSNNILMDRYGSASTTKPIEINKWFTVVSKIYQTSSTARTIKTTILDELGEVVVSYTRPGNIDPTSYFTPVYIDGSKIKSGTAKLVLDDVKIYNYTDASLSPSFDAASTELKEGATGVGFTKPFILTFDQEVKADNSAVKIYKKADETKTAISATVSTAFNKVIITPSSYLDKGVEYVIDFSGVTNESNKALDSTSAKTLTFETSELTPPPAIVLSSIENGASEIETSIKSATVTFDQPIDIEDSVAKLTYGTDGVIPATISATETANVYTISWTADLSGLTTYTIDLSGVVNAENPEGSGNKAKISFTTKSINPDVVACEPANGENSASISLREIILTYDQEITQKPATVLVKGGTADISATVSTEDNKTFKISLTDALEGNTAYTIDLTGFGNANGTSYTTEYTFKTEYASIVKLTESFDDPALIKVGETSTSYGSADSVLSMDLSVAGTDVSLSETLTQETVSGDDKALALTTGEENATYVKTIRTTTPHSITKDEALVATWRFNLKELGDFDLDNSKMGTKIAMGLSGGKTIGFSSTLAYIYTYAEDGGAPSIYYTGSNASTRRAIKEDCWYNAIMKVDAYTKTLDIVDADESSDTFGKIIYSKTVSNSTGLPWGGENDPFYFHIGLGSREESSSGIFNQNQKFLLNDFTLWRVKKTAPQMALKVESVEDNEIASDENLLVTFNQPVFPNDPVVSVYTGENGEDNAYTFTESSIVDFCKYKINFTNLDPLKDYEIDFSKTSAISGAPFDANNSRFEFSTTSDPVNGVTVLGGLESTGVDVGDSIKTTLYSDETKTVTVMAALYDRFPAKLAKVFTQDVDLEAGEKTPVAFTLEEDYPEAGRVKLFVWDKDEKFDPQAKAEARVTADDNIKVLMWGNSLSEDAQRYLNKIAEASGITLDITMKGRGGTALTQHAENLKTEIETGEVVNGYFSYYNGVYVTDPTDESRSILKALTTGEYDYVSIQQVASSFGYEEDVREEMGDALVYMVSNVRKFQPTAEILLYEAWATRDTLRSARNSVYKDSIHPSYEHWAEKVQKETSGITVNDQILRFIPAGDAYYYADNRLPWGETMWTDGDSGNTNVEAKDKITTKMLASAGLWRDYNHASWYGCYLADAVWLGTLTGVKAAIVDANGDPVVPAPTGISAEEHLQRLSDLSDIAYTVVLKNR